MTIYFHIICPNDAVVFLCSDRVAQEKLDFCREQSARVYAASPGSEPTAGDDKMIMFAQ